MIGSWLPTSVRNACLILCLHEVEWGTPDEFFWLIAQQVVTTGTGIAVNAIGIHFPDPVPAALNQISEFFLAGSQRRFDLFLCGDVPAHTNDGNDRACLIQKGCIDPTQPTPTLFSHGPLFQIRGMGGVI